MALTQSQIDGTSCTRCGDTSRPMRPILGLGNQVECCNTIACRARVARGGAAVVEPPGTADPDP